MPIRDDTMLGGGGANWARQDSTSFSGITSGTSTHLNTAPATACFFVNVTINNTGTGRIAVTDSAGNTYTLAKGQSGTNQRTELWYCLNGTGQGVSHTFTVTSQSGDYFCAVASCFTCTYVPHFDTAVGASGTGTALDSGSFTPTYLETPSSGYLLLGAGGQDSNRAFTAGTTSQTFSVNGTVTFNTNVGALQEYSLGVADQSAQKATASLDLSEDWTMIAAGFVDATQQTQTGKARITATTTKTQSGVAHINSSTVTTTKTQSAKANIRATTTQTQTGKANISSGGVTVVDVYVDTRSSGGDGTTSALSGTNAAYSSLNAALTAKAANLVTGAYRVVIHCNGTSDSTQPTFSGWTTNSTYYLTIQVDVANRHSGYPDTTKYYLNSNYWGINNFPAYTRFIGIQLQNSGDDINLACWSAGNGATSQGSVLIDCIGWYTSKNRTYGNRHGYFGGTDATYDPQILVNCVFYLGTGTQGRTGNYGIGSTNGNLYAYNCTVDGGATSNDSTAVAFSDGYARVTTKNCIAINFPSIGNAHGTGTDYTATDCATAGNGSHSRASQTFSFVNSAIQNYQLTSSDTGAKGYGEDLSADATYAFSDDIAGSTRSTPWDIGAWKAQGGSTTTTKTQLGVARITATATKTQPAKARIQLTTTQTQSGKSRIQLITTQTQTAKSRITASATRTQTALSRITASALKTITGLARITAQTLRTQPGKARITATTTKTTAALARVTASTSRTQSGVANIAAAPITAAFDSSSHPTGQAGATSRTWAHTTSGTNRVLIVMTAVSHGVGSVAPTSVTYNGVALTQYGNQIGDSGELTVWYLLNPALGTNNITVTYASATAWYVGAASFTGVASLANGTGSTQANNAPSITVTSTTGNLVLGILDGAGTNETLTPANANIFTDTTSGSQAMEYATSAATSTTVSWSSSSGVTWNLYGLELVSGAQSTTTTKTQPAKANIRATTSQAQTAKARVTATAQKAITALSRVTAISTRTQAAIARITALATKTQAGKARVTAQTTQTQSGKSRITASTQRTQNAKGNISATTTRTQTAVAAITTLPTKTIAGKASIKATTTRTQTAVARIQQTVLKTQSALARISLITTRTQTALSRITAVTVKTITGTAAINGATVKTQTALARITATATRTQGAISRIQQSVTQTLTGKARVSLVTSKTQSAKANLASASTRTQTAKGRVTATTQRTQSGVARIGTIWGNETEHTTTWTSESEHTTSWTSETEHSTIWTDEPKH